MIIIMNNPVFKKALAIFIGFIVFILLVFAGFRIFGTRAADYEPTDVVVSNIEKNSVRLSWATGVDTQAVVEYGTSPTALNFFSPEATKEKSHSLELNLLSPSTTYYFDIRIGDKKFDNGGVPWTFTTKGAEASTGSLITPTKIPPTNTDKQISPTPIQSLQIPNTSSGCNETNCEAIKSKLGKGCSTRDYILCIKKQDQVRQNP